MDIGSTDRANASSRRVTPSQMREGPIVRPMLALAAPMVAVLVAQTIVGVAETFYVGLLGTDALAGAALVFPLLMLMTMMANGGIGGGVASAIARATGAGRRGDADALVLHALILAIVFGACFTAAAIVFGPRLYAALGARSNVLALAVKYSTFIFAAAIPTWMTNLMAAALRGIGNVRVPALVTLLGTFVLVPLSPLFIFGYGPIPRFGIAGAGIAIAIYYLGATAFLLAYLASGRGGLTLRLARPQWRLFASILRVGLISAVGTLVANLTVVVLTGLIGQFGADAIAGYGAASRLDYVQIPFLFGLGTAVVTMVGVNVGAGQHLRARRIAWAGASIAALAAEMIGLAAAAFPASIVAGGAVATVAVVTVGAVAFASHKLEAPLVSPIPVVRTILVTAGSPGGPHYTGVVHARYESALGFRVAGKIAERMVDPGDRVRKGQALMRLDETDFSLALKAAHAAVEAARANSIQAASDEARRRKLVGEGWVTAQAYEQNKALSDATAAQLASALAQEKQVADQAGYAILQADADGVIMEVPSDPGQVVAAGQTVVRLAHDGSREAEIYLPEGSEREAGDPAVATLYARPNEGVPAILRELSAMADPATRTYRARYVLGGNGKTAPLGATVTVRLSQAKNGSVFDVPVGAVFDAGHGPSVWVVDPDTSSVAARTVTIERMGEERAAISSGLVPGERIVSLGAHLLKPGERVEIANSPLDTTTQ
jgi:RND family efflux transporter MFP subunit/putative MATE family efflux protein